MDSTQPCPHSFTYTRTYDEAELTPWATATSDNLGPGNCPRMEAARPGPLPAHPGAGTHLRWRCEVMRRLAAPRGLRCPRGSAGVGHTPGPAGCSPWDPVRGSPRGGRSAGNPQPARAQVKGRSEGRRRAAGLRGRARPATQGCSFAQYWAAAGCGWAPRVRGARPGAPGPCPPRGGDPRTSRWGSPQARAQARGPTEKPANAGAIITVALVLLNCPLSFVF